MDFGRLGQTWADLGGLCRHGWILGGLRWNWTYLVELLGTWLDLGRSWPDLGVIGLTLGGLGWTLGGLRWTWVDSG